MAKRKPDAAIRVKDVPGVPDVALYRPGSRKANRKWVCRGTVDGIPREATSEIADPKGEESAWQWWCGYVAALREEGAAVRTGHPTTVAELMDAWISINRPSRKREPYFTKLRDDPEVGPLPLDELTEHDLKQAALRLYPGCKGQTLNGNAITPWCTAITYAARQKWCRPLLVERFTEEAVAPRRPKPGTAERAIRAAADMGARDMHDWLLFIFHQGWRATESLSPPPDAINYTRGTIRVFVSKARKGRKQGVWKEVPLHPVTLAMFERRKSDGLMEADRIWPWRNRVQLRRALDPVLLHAGLAKIVGYRKVRSHRNRNGTWRYYQQPIIKRSFTPHMARHEWESQAAESGLTGHDMVDGNTWTNPNSPNHYRHVTDLHRRRIASTVSFGIETESGENSGEAERNV